MVGKYSANNTACALNNNSRMSVENKLSAGSSIHVRDAKPLCWETLVYAKCFLAESRVAAEQLENVQTETEVRS